MREPSDAPSDIHALVLAAGQSKRMGAVNKLLLPWRGLPIVRHVVLQALSSSAAAVTVVTGADRVQIEAALSDLPVTFTHNPEYDDGLATSLRQGLRSVDHQATGVMVCLGDMPRVESADMNELLRTFERHQADRICVPTFQGQRGNPIVIGRQWFDALLIMTGDAGARTLIQANPDLVCKVEMTTDAVVFDIDTPAAYAQLTHRS